MSENNKQANSQGLILTGLDGSNPLAFLAALGTLRTLSLACPEGDVKMRWVEHAAAWRPVIEGGSAQEEACSELVDETLQRMSENPALGMADNLTLSGEEFRAFALGVLGDAFPTLGVLERMALDFAAAFACDLLIDDQSRIQDTALRTMSGAGHQHFVASMRTIAANTKVEHISKALFRQWIYDDPVASQSLRWDPSEDSRYALQWRNPSGDPTRNQRGTMLGANRLAIEAIPLLMCAPVRNTLRTTAFVGRGARTTYFTWPIWDTPISLDVVRSLLASTTLEGGSPNSVPILKAVGVRCAFRSQRITTGKFRNFTPAVAVF